MYLKLVVVLAIGLSSWQVSASEKYVAVNTLNVRNSPDGAVVDRLERATQVSVYEQAGSWARITPDSEEARWVAAKHLCVGDNCWKSVDSEGSSGKFAERGRAAIRNLLLDPASAQFRTLHSGPNLVCGKVNAKNRMGGYVGFRDFGYLREGSEIHTYLEGGTEGRPDSVRAALACYYKLANQ
jgi:hypothetical protein